MQVTPTGAFLRNLKKLSEGDKAATVAALERFVVEPWAPILNFEQVTARKGYCTIRATIKIRILLRLVEDECFDIVAVGNHDYVYASYFKK